LSLKKRPASLRKKKKMISSTKRNVCGMKLLLQIAAISFGSKKRHGSCTRTNRGRSQRIDSDDANHPFLFGRRRPQTKVHPDGDHAELERSDARARLVNGDLAVGNDCTLFSHVTKVQGATPAVG